MFDENKKKWEIVEWYDHSGDSGERWKSEKEIIEDTGSDCVIRTHGVIIKEEEDRLIIASEERRDRDLIVPMYRSYSVIYKKLIISREKFPQPKPTTLVGKGEKDEDRTGS